MSILSAAGITQPCAFCGLPGAARSILVTPTCVIKGVGGGGTQNRDTRAGRTTTMPLFKLLRPALPILIGASVMLTLSMGLRQSLGIFLQPLTRDVGISVSDFTLAIAVQNLAWGFLQPFAGALTVRYGFRVIMVAGAILYIAGLVLLASAQGFLGVMIGAGVLIGMSLACTAAAIAMSVAARAVPTAVRSTVLGIVSAAGSLGALLSAPLGQLLNEGYGWRTGLVGFVVLSLALLPAAWFGGKVG